MEGDQVAAVGADFGRVKVNTHRAPFPLHQGRTVRQVAADDSGVGDGPVQIAINGHIVFCWHLHLRILVVPQDGVDMPAQNPMPPVPEDMAVAVRIGMGIRQADHPVVPIAPLEPLLLIQGLFRFAICGEQRDGLS